MECKSKLISLSYATHDNDKQGYKYNYLLKPHSILLTENYSLYRQDKTLVIVYLDSFLVNQGMRFGV